MQNVKEEERNDVIITLDTDEGKKELTDEVVDWSELELARNEAADDLIQQQMLFTELATVYKEKLNNDKEAFAIVDGAVKTFYDIANEIVENSLQHAVETEEIEPGVSIPTKYRSGTVTGTDEQLEYFGIASKYIHTAEKIAYISSTMYLDVFAKLKLDATELSNAYNQGVSDLATITQKGE